MVREHGNVGVCPALVGEYDVFRSQDYTFSSSWSERHIAFSAGLGRFGLNGCLITPAGANVRFGSIITNLPLEPTPEQKQSHSAACLENGGMMCGRCMEKCPVLAISERGLDKALCYERKKAIEAQFIHEYTHTLKMVPHPLVKKGRRTKGYSLGCALCQTGVPCENEYPEFLNEDDRHA